MSLKTNSSTVLLLLGAGVKSFRLTCMIKHTAMFELCKGDVNGFGA